LIKPEHIPKPYYKLHHGKTGVWLARIRMGLSALNSQRYTYNFIDSPKCDLCRSGNENTIHYLWDCIHHTQPRNHMMGRLTAELGIVANRANIEKIVIHGQIENRDNLKLLMQIVSEYYISTSRFK